jgi:hypothetical protein
MSQIYFDRDRAARAEVDFWLISEVVAGFIQVSLFGSIAAQFLLS